MRARRAPARIVGMSQTIETTTSVTVIHGAMLSFEWIGATGAADAPLRLREHHETLLRVIDGTVMLELDGDERAMTIEDEARIPAGVPHRLWKAGAGEARIVHELRRVG
jgi:mannose-6-phosphate isomerase-like protein (cupin superfamily)